MVERINDFRQRVDDGLVFRDLAIEHAQRIGDGAALAVDAHLGGNGDEGCAKHFVIASTIRGGADGVDFECPAGNAELVEERGKHFEDFSVAKRGFAAGGRRTDDFGADLRELAVAALLRTLAAELRGDVIELLQCSSFAKLVLDRKSVV